MILISSPAQVEGPAAGRGKVDDGRALALIHDPDTKRAWPPQTDR